MPKELRKSTTTFEKEELSIINECSHCEKPRTQRNHLRDFSGNRKITKNNILKFNELMTKPRQRKKQIGDSLCDNCYKVFMKKIQQETRALHEKLDTKIEKNENIIDESTKMEDTEPKVDETLSNPLMKAIQSNLLF